MIGLKAFQSFSLVACLGATLIQCSALHAQFVSSSFGEASTAQIALSGLGANFSFSNPALLCDMPKLQRFAVILEADHQNAETVFKDDFPDFALHLKLHERVTVGLARSERNAYSLSYALRSGADEPFYQHPLGELQFEFGQDWAIGIGYKFRLNWNVGVTMRHEKYQTLAFPLGLLLQQTFRAFDFGVRKSTAKLDFGLVLRNAIDDRITKPLPGPIRIRVAPDSLIVWDANAFPNIANEPSFAAETGLVWRASSHWSFLGDVTTRKEYALGLRWRVFSKFYITTGTGKRFDRIYAAEAVTYTTLGGQFQNQKLALGLTWIIPTREGRNSFVQQSYGQYELRQITNHRLLLAVGVSL